MSAQDRLCAIRDAALALIASRPEVMDFIGTLPESYPFAPLPPQARPAQAIIARLEPPPETEALVRAIQAASDGLRWNATYSKAEVGADFLQRYGWIDIIGPRGPFVAHGFRVMAGFWDAGLHYPVHWHEAEEVYVPIAGSARFWSERSGERHGGVGDAIFHATNEKHAATMDAEPLFALAIWRGADLAVNPAIESAGTGEVVRVREVTS